MEKKKMYAIAAVVVVVLVLVIGLGVGLTRKKEDPAPTAPVGKQYTLVPGVSYIYNSQPGKDAADGGYQFLGNYSSIDLVKAAASAKGYSHFTWCPPAYFTDAYSGAAYGMNVVKSRVGQDNIISADATA